MQGEGSNNNFNPPQQESRFSRILSAFRKEPSTPLPMSPAAEAEKRNVQAILNSDISGNLTKDQAEFRLATMQQTNQVLPHTEETVKKEQEIVKREQDAVWVAQVANKYQLSELDQKRILDQNLSREDAEALGSLRNASRLMQEENAAKQRLQTAQTSFPHNSDAAEYRAAAAGWVDPNRNLPKNPDQVNNTYTDTVYVRSATAPVPDTPAIVESSLNISKIETNEESIELTNLINQAIENRNIEESPRELVGNFSRRFKGEIRSIDNGKRDLRIHDASDVLPENRVKANTLDGQVGIVQEFWIIDNDKAIKYVLGENKNWYMSPARLLDNVDGKKKWEILGYSKPDDQTIALLKFQLGQLTSNNEAALAA